MRAQGSLGCEAFTLPRPPPGEAPEGTAPGGEGEITEARLPTPALLNQKPGDGPGMSTLNSLGGDSETTAAFGEDKPGSSSLPP